MEEGRGHRAANCIVELRFVFDLAAKQVVILVDQLVAYGQLASLGSIEGVGRITIFERNDDVPGQRNLIVEIGDDLFERLLVTTDTMRRGRVLSRFIAEFNIAFIYWFGIVLS